MNSLQALRKIDQGRVISKWRPVVVHAFLFDGAELIVVDLELAGDLRTRLMHWNASILRLDKRQEDLTAALHGESRAGGLADRHDGSRKDGRRAHLLLYQTRRAMPEDSRACYLIKVVSG